MVKENLTIKNLYNEFMEMSKLENRTSKISMEKVQESFYTGVGMTIDMLRDKISYLEEEEAMAVLEAINLEAINFFEDKVKKRDEEGDSVFDSHMIEIAEEKFEFVLGVDQSTNIHCFTLVKKKPNGFEVIISRGAKDHAKIASEIALIADVFNADIVKTNFKGSKQ